MRVLLVSANTEQINMQVLPLGVAQVAAATEQAGHEVSLLNLSPGLEHSPAGPLAVAPELQLGARRASIDQTTAVVEGAIRSFQPDVIGISVRNIDDQNMQAPRFLLEPVRDVVRACRAVSAAPIIVGGAGYSIFADAALAYLQADIGVAGEGEAVFPAFLGSGVNSALTNLLHDSVIRELRPDPLDTFPAPDPARWLASAPRDSWVPVQSRRGCPLDCSYCSTASIEGRQVRRRSPQLVAAELASAKAAGFSHFYFVDNTFNLPESYALRLCREIARLDLGITWRCIIYPRRISEDLARALREAGCVEASVGFEAGNEPMLAALNKRFSLDDVRTTCARLADQGISRNGFLLLGGPGETHHSIDESLAFAESLRLDFLKVTLGIRIYPGTPLHRTALAERVVSADDDLLQPRFYLARGIEPSRVHAAG